MKRPRLITRRRAKWAGVAALAMCAVTYAAALASGWGDYRLRANGWSVTAWLMDGRVEVWASKRHPRKPDEGLLVQSRRLPRGALSLMDFYLRSYDVDTESTGTYPWFKYPPNPRFDLDWQKNRSRYVYFDAYLAIPLWCPLVLIALPTAWLWYTDRRGKPWQCGKCRYDLRGIEGGVCPECGAPVTGGGS